MHNLWGFVCEWCEEIKNRPLVAGDFRSWMASNTMNDVLNPN